MGAAHPTCIPCSKAAKKRSPPPREDCAFLLDPGEVHDGPPRRTHSTGDLIQRKNSGIVAEYRIYFNIEMGQAASVYTCYLPCRNRYFFFMQPQFNISAIAAGFQLNTGIAVIPTVANDVGIISVHGPLYCRDRIAVPYLNSLIENHVECLSECTNYFKCNFHPLHQATASLNCSHVISLQKRRSGTYRDCRKRDC